MFWFHHHFIPLLPMFSTMSPRRTPGTLLRWASCLKKTIQFPPMLTLLNWLLQPSGRTPIMSRPRIRIVLLHGPPGLSPLSMAAWQISHVTKTTLAPATDRTRVWSAPFFLSLSPSLPGSSINYHRGVSHVYVTVSTRRYNIFNFLLGATHDISLIKCMTNDSRMTGRWSIWPRPNFEQNVSQDHYHVRFFIPIIF